MKDEITEVQYWTIIAMFIICIPLVIDAVLRWVELGVMLNG